MFHKEYSNFVKSVSPEPHLNQCGTSNNRLNGEEAKRLYLEELKDAAINESFVNSNTTAAPIPVDTSTHYSCRKRRKLDEIDVSHTNLFLCVQSNDVCTLNDILDACPEKLNIVDEFGWSLLMIACQANSLEAVKELLKRGIDISVRDKAGNSARSLVIKNKNFILADILLKANIYETKEPKKTPKVKLKEEYVCEICNNKVFADKYEHLSSIGHNLNASKGKKIPAKFMIPSSNIGYQIMLKEGWDRDSGLGKDGSGKKYPVKAVQKLDRKGLGVEKKSNNMKQNGSSKDKFKSDYHENRRFEIKFRREFY